MLNRAVLTRFLINYHLYLLWNGHPCPFLTQTACMGAVRSTRTAPQDKYPISNKTKNTMKAVQVHQFGAPEVLKVEEISAPKPNAGQVLIRVHAAGVSLLDTYVREQSHGAPTPPLPYIPGFEAAGVIETVGEGVTKFKTGDRVYVNTFLGAYAELVVHDAESVYPLPDVTSFAQATE
jgi:NADPH-dependent curcumin reductase CurA